MKPTSETQTKKQTNLIDIEMVLDYLLLRFDDLTMSLGKGTVQEKSSAGRRVSDFAFTSRVISNLAITLIYLHQVDSSTTALWIGLFPIAACLVSFIINMFTEFVCIIQPVYTQIRSRVVRRLIWGYTVCKYPFYGTPGMNVFYVFVNVYLLSTIPDTLEF